MILWVSATDKKGNYLTDLRKEQFEVFEDGNTQPILEFFREDRPITLAILLDSSGSMLDKLREVHKAAAAFVDTLRPEDQALIIDFDDKVFLIQDLTSNHELLKDALTSTEAIGGTAIYDVLHAAYRKIGSLPGRKAIVLLSDGEDTASQYGFKRVLEEAKSNNTLIYSIGLGGRSRRGRAQERAQGLLGRHRRPGLLRQQVPTNWARSTRRSPRSYEPSTSWPTPRTMKSGTAAGSRSASRRWTGR